MRFILCMSHTCPWSHSIAVSLKAMGHEIYGFDFAAAREGGFASTDNPDIQSDMEGYRTAITEFHLERSVTRGNLRYVLAAPAFRRFAARVRPHAVLSLGGRGYALMMYLSGVRPYAVYVVGSEVLLASAMGQRVNRVVLGGSAAVFANGEYLASRAREQSPAATIHTLLIGVDVDRLPVARFDTTPVQLVCTRGFSPVYNNEAILRALALLPADIPEYRMVFVSGGVDLARTVALADRILPPAVRARVHFLGGVAYPKVIEALERSHIFLSMSRSDGTATSLLEAMGCGLFPIVSDIPQNRPFVRAQEGNGRLVPLDDPAALASAIEHSLRDLESCRRQAPRNRAIVRELASASRLRRALAAHLEAIASGTRTEPACELSN